MDPREQLALQLLMDERRRGRIGPALEQSMEGGYVPPQPPVPPVEDLQRDYGAMAAGAVDMFGIPSAVAGQMGYDGLREAQEASPNMALAGSIMSPLNWAVPGALGAAAGAGIGWARNAMKAPKAADALNKGLGWSDAAKHFGKIYNGNSPALNYDAVRYMRDVAGSAVDHLGKAANYYRHGASNWGSTAGSALAGGVLGGASDLIEGRFDGDTGMKVAAGAIAGGAGERAANFFTRSRLNSIESKGLERTLSDMREAERDSRAWLSQNRPPSPNQWPPQQGPQTPPGRPPIAPPDRTGPRPPDPGPQMLPPGPQNPPGRPPQASEALPTPPGPNTRTSPPWASYDDAFSKKFNDSMKGRQFIPPSYDGYKMRDELTRALSTPPPSRQIVDPGPPLAPPKGKMPGFLENDARAPGKSGKEMAAPRPGDVGHKDTNKPPRQKAGKVTPLPDDWPKQPKRKKPRKAPDFLANDPKVKK